MWHDTEAKVDLLNFSLVAEAAAQLIRESDSEPITIGISGGWGVGKSSLVKMVGASLQKDSNNETKYVFLEFNAWLYQGFDDARQALLQSVSDKLLEVATERKTLVEKALAFAKRIRLLKLTRVAAPAVAGLVVGGTVAGPLGALVGAVSGLVRSAGDASTEKQIQEVKDAYAKLKPEVAGIVDDRVEESLPKEIDGLRKAFEELLTTLDVRLVVLVDDLDRCLPNTAIATLEAMRLLLFVQRTAFIIAADEQMIRGAVRVHFGEVVNDELVTSYFDKLIQVPLRVPRLGVNEVKVYVAILLAQLSVRRGKLPLQSLADAQPILLDALKSAWSGGITREILSKAFGSNSSVISQQIDIAEQLAPLLVIAEQISGNPRLIKRFLNNLVIRESIANAQGMTIGFPELVKMQLFERCASPVAFEFLAGAVAKSDDGRAAFLGALEEAAAKDEPYDSPDASWSTVFYERWIRLSPALAEINLKPLLYLSRDRALALASYDELSPEASKLLEALLKTDQLITNLIPQVKALGELEAERLLIRLVRRARSDQWSSAAITRCVHVTKAFESLGVQLAAALSEIPGPQRAVPIVPLIRSEPWAQELLNSWASDPSSSKQLRTAINLKTGK